MSNEKQLQIMLSEPIKIKCDSMVGETELIGVYKCGRSFRAFDSFGNWFTVKKLPFEVQKNMALVKAIFDYNNKLFLNTFAI